MSDPYTRFAQDEARRQAAARATAKPVSTGAAMAAGRNKAQEITTGQVGQPPQVATVPGQAPTTVGANDDPQMAMRQQPAPQMEAEDPIKQRSEALKRLMFAEEIADKEKAANERATASQAWGGLQGTTQSRQVLQGKGGDGKIAAADLAALDRLSRMGYDISAGGGVIDLRGTGLGGTRPQWSNSAPGRTMSGGTNQTPIWR